MPRAPNLYTLFNFLACNTVTVTAFPIYPAFEASPDLRPLITVVITFLGLLAMFVMFKCVYLKSRRIETIHSPRNPSTPQFRNVDVDFSEKTQAPSRSKSKALAQDLSTDLDDILVGFLGSPLWETTSHSTLDMHLRKQRQEYRRAYQQHKAKAQRRTQQVKARMSIVGRIRASFVPAPVSAAVLRFSGVCPSLDEIEAQLDGVAFSGPRYGVKWSSHLVPPKPGDLGYNDSWTTAEDSEELEKHVLSSPLENPGRRLKFADNSSAKLSTSSSFVALPSMASISPGLRRNSLHIVFEHDSDSYSMLEHLDSQENLIWVQSSQPSVTRLSDRGRQPRSEGLLSELNVSMASPVELTDANLVPAGLRLSRRSEGRRSPLLDPEPSTPRSGRESFESAQPGAEELDIGLLGLDRYRWAETHRAEESQVNVSHSREDSCAVVSLVDRSGSLRRPS